MRMKNKILVLSMTFASIGIANAQALKRQVISCYGNSTLVDGVTYSQTVGQPHSTSATDGTESFYSGFQQPIMIEQIQRQKELNVTIFPNPASMSFRLKSSERVENASIQIVDSKGMIVFKQEILEFDNQEFDCGQFDNGVYIIQIRKNNLTQSSKLIIQK